MKANTFLKPYGFKFYEMSTGENSNYKNVLLDIEGSEHLDYKPIFGLLLSYSFKEYTFIMVYQDGSEFPCSIFYNFDVETTKALRVQLKKYNILIDNFDIDVPIQLANNKKQVIYNHLLRYLDEQSM